MSRNLSFTSRFGIHYLRTSNENNFRTAAYEAITSYATHATPDVVVVVEKTLVVILNRMEQLLGMQAS